MEKRRIKGKDDALNAYKRVRQESIQRCDCRGETAVIDFALTYTLLSFLTFCTSTSLVLLSFHSL